MEILRYEAHIPWQAMARHSDEAIQHHEYVAYRALAEIMHKESVARREVIKPEEDDLDFYKGATIRYDIVVETNAAKARNIADLVEEARRQGFAAGAASVADEAIRRIDQWGSHFHHQSISKEDARRFVREASHAITKRKSEDIPQ